MSSMSDSAGQKLNDVPDRGFFGYGKCIALHLHCIACNKKTVGRDLANVMCYCYGSIDGFFCKAYRQAFPSCVVISSFVPLTLCG
jgi:hypothetical protein